MYEKRFNNLDKLLIDASASYTKMRISDSKTQDETPASRAYNLNPEAKIIYIARNPIERAYSSYFNEKRYGNTVVTSAHLFRRENYRILEISYYKQLSY